MQYAAWEALLRHIPAEQQNGYMVVTTAGVEIAVQNFLRIERELLVFKGRLSGSQDQGLLFFLPYSRIEYVGTMKAVKDSEFEETFGSLQFPGPAKEAAPAAKSEAPPAPPPPGEIGKPSGSKSGSKLNIRSEVLERFRNRSASSASLPSPLPPG
jgi:hypothetical protein